MVERFTNYWNKGQVHFERIVYQPIVDATVRLANLRSGQLDFIERVAPSDIPNLRNDSRFKIAKIVEIGYQGITINVGKSDLAQKNPLGRDPRVREAFELSLDREAIVKVAMEGEAQAGNQWVAPSNRFYGKSAPLPKRNVERAKQLLKEAGVPNPSFTLMTPTTSDAQRIAQIVQAMAKEAGFDIKIQSTEFATSLNLADKVSSKRTCSRGAAVPIGRQPAHHAGLQGSDELRGVLQGRRREAHHRVTHLARCDAARRCTTRSRSRCRRTARSSTSSIATGSGRIPRSCPACAPFRTAWCGCELKMN